MGFSHQFVLFERKFLIFEKIISRAGRRRSPVRYNFLHFWKHTFLKKQFWKVCMFLDFSILRPLCKTASSREGCWGLKKVRIFLLQHERKNNPLNSFEIMLSGHTMCRKMSRARISFYYCTVSIGATTATPASSMLKMVNCRLDVNWDTWDYEDE